MEVQLEEVSSDQLTQQEINEFQIFEEEIPIVEKILEVPLIDGNNNRQQRRDSPILLKRKRQCKKNKFSETEQGVVDRFLNSSITFYEAVRQLQILPADHDETADELDLETDEQIETKRKTRSSLKPQNEETRQERQRKKLPPALRGLMGEGN